MILSIFYTGLSLALSSTFGLLTTILVVLAVWWYSKIPKNLPPGPLGIPFLGYVPFLATSRGNLGMIYNRISQKYNSPVISIVLGNIPIVTLCDYQAVKDAFVLQGEDFAGRPTKLLEKVLPNEMKTIPFSDGAFWREHRRFALSTLRDFGIGKSSLEPSILSEIFCFLEELEKYKEKPVQMEALLSRSVCNNICVLQFGKRFEYDDPAFTELKKQLDLQIQFSNGNQFESFLPFLKKIPFLKQYLPTIRMRKCQEVFEEYMTAQLNEHKSEYIPGKKNDYINAYLTEQLVRQKGGNDGELFDDETLVVNLRSFYIAGTETTTDTLSWIIIYMMLNPEIQSKVQKEIDEVIGSNRSPSYEDRLRMPYTEATILETHRRACVVCLTIPHATTRDVQFRGYDLPKGTAVFANIWALHHDERYFPDPFVFKPERFIDEDGKLNRSECIIPFSLGKRFCVGEPLARMEIFLYFTSLLQKFDLRAPAGLEVDINGTGGHKLFNHPKPYNVILAKRKKTFKLKEN